MKAYEGVFIFPPDASSEARKAQEKQIEDAIKKLQGVITQKTEWGKKPLGYSIRKYREGIFLILDFQVDTLKMRELRNLFELQEDLLKFMVTVKPPLMKPTLPVVAAVIPTPTPIPTPAPAKPAAASHS